MSKRKEMIQSLDSISRFNTYSKYSLALNKMFKNNSLKDFIKSLKNPIHIDSFQFINDFDKKTKRTEDDLDINLFPKGYLVKGKELDLLHDEYIPEEENKDKDKEMNRNSFYKNKGFNSMTNFNTIIKRKEGLDPFKYNPNYNSIYKNSPSFKMVPHTTISLKKIENKSSTFLTDIKGKKSKEKIMEKNINLKIDTTDDLHDSKYNENENEIKSHIPLYKNINYNSDMENNNKNEIVINNNDMKSRNYNTLPEINALHYDTKNKKGKKNKFRTTNNHAFRFSKYPSRKLNIYKVNKRLTYLEPYDYCSTLQKNKALDFNKMEYRNPNNWISVSKLSTPSFYYYNPKYDCIEKKPMNIIFNPKQVVERNNKKNIIKKIWSMYDVRREYLSIDNDKLK